MNDDHLEAYPENERPPASHRPIAFAWTGADLRRLRESAEIPDDVMAIALAVSPIGLRNLEARRKISIDLLERYREAIDLVLAFGEEVEE